jgi:hypothetical protein
MNVARKHNLHREKDIVIPVYKGTRRDIENFCNEMVATKVWQNTGINSNVTNQLAVKIKEQLAETDERNKKRGYKLGAEDTRPNLAVVRVYVVTTTESREPQEGWHAHRQHEHHRGSVRGAQRQLQGNPGRQQGTRRQEPAAAEEGIRHEDAVLHARVQAGCRHPEEVAQAMKTVCGRCNGSGTGTSMSGSTHACDTCCGRGFLGEDPAEPKPMERAGSLQRAIENNAGKVIQTLLEGFWALPTVDNGTFERLHDDHDGTYEGTIGVTRAIDGDMHVWINSRAGLVVESNKLGKVNSDWLRFRSAAGGGRSLRTHNALRILAEAIRLDAIEDPHTRRCPSTPSSEQLGLSL